MKSVPVLTNTLCNRTASARVNVRLDGKVMDATLKLYQNVQMTAVNLVHATKINVFVCQIGPVNFVKFHRVPLKSKASVALEKVYV